MQSPLTVPKLVAVAQVLLAACENNADDSSRNTEASERFFMKSGFFLWILIYDKDIQVL